MSDTSNRCLPSRPPPSMTKAVLQCTHYFTPACLCALFAMPIAAYYRAKQARPSTDRKPEFYRPLVKFYTHTISIKALKSIKVLVRYCYHHHLRFEPGLAGSPQFSYFTCSRRASSRLSCTFFGKMVRPMLLDHCLSCDVGVLWPNGWMDQDATWYGGRNRPRRRCVRWGLSFLQRKRAKKPLPSPLFSPLLWHGRPSQRLLSSFYEPHTIHVIHPTVLKH